MGLSIRRSRFQRISHGKRGNFVMQTRRAGRKRNQLGAGAGTYTQISARGGSLFDHDRSESKVVLRAVEGYKFG